MSLLFVVRQPPSSPLFKEGLTALLGASLFGQDTELLLLGRAASIRQQSEGTSFQQLTDLLELGMSKVYLEGPDTGASFATATTITKKEITVLMQKASSIISF